MLQTEVYTNSCRLASRLLTRTHEIIHLFWKNPPLFSHLVTEKQNSFTIIIFCFFTRNSLLKRKTSFPTALLKRPCLHALPYARRTKHLFQVDDCVHTKDCENTKGSLALARLPFVRLTYLSEKIALRISHTTGTVHTAPARPGSLSILPLPLRPRCVQCTPPHDPSPPLSYRVW